MLTSPPPRRLPARPKPFLILLLLTSVACPGQTARYTAAEDESAMALIASSWAELGTNLTLSLCEDVAASDEWVGPDCSEEHVVKGGGRALEHTESHPRIGCGGCLFSVVAYVVGTLSGGPFPAPVAVRGTVKLQSGWDDEPYALPWGVDLRCEGGADCTLTGTIRADGTLEAELAAPAAAPPTASVLQRSGDATCP